MPHKANVGIELLLFWLLSLGLCPLARAMVMPGVSQSAKGRSWSHGAPVAIAWSIAGSDSGGGAGIQADLHTMKDFVTAQNSLGVLDISYLSPEAVGKSIAALESDLYPKVVKLGMLGSICIMKEIVSFLDRFNGSVVIDPVMVSSSGSPLMDKNAIEFFKTEVLPKSSLLTPNRMEAEVLVGHPISTHTDMELAADELLKMGAKAVLMKGGHLFDNQEEKELRKRGAEAPCTTSDSVANPQVAQVDFYASSDDRAGRFWLCSPWISTIHTHGTGCTLSSAIAACLASRFSIEDSITVAKAYVTKGVMGATPFGIGPGPVAHLGWPSDFRCMPVQRNQVESILDFSGAFPRMNTSSWGVYPIVPSANWVSRLASRGVSDIQLRIKGLSEEEIDYEVAMACKIAREYGIRLWVNDHWMSAIKHRAWGVHIGQEDLKEIMGLEVNTKKYGSGDREGLRLIATAGLCLGISTHTYSELALALAFKPTYVAIGPVYETKSKEIKFGARGLDKIIQWRSLVPPDTPIIAIGGITLKSAKDVITAGADGIAAIKCITDAPDLERDLEQWKAIFKKA